MADDLRRACARCAARACTPLRESGRLRQIELTIYTTWPAADPAHHIAFADRHTMKQWLDEGACSLRKHVRADPALKAISVSREMIRPRLLSSLVPVGDAAAHARTHAVHIILSPASRCFRRKLLESHHTLTQQRWQSTAYRFSREAPSAANPPAARVHELFGAGATASNSVFMSVRATLARLAVFARELAAMLLYGRETAEPDPYKR